MNRLSFTKSRFFERNRSTKSRTVSLVFGQITSSQKDGGFRLPRQESQFPSSFGQPHSQKNAISSYQR